jgi:SAM-dependent methyltransferase
MSFEIFRDIYLDRRWGGKESVSGPGASLEQTGTIREQLPLLIKEFDIKSMIDIPCGDFHWMKHVDLRDCHYIGADILPELIEADRQQYNYEFRLLDISQDPLPQVDLFFSRDCLVHFPFEYIERTIRNIRRSDSRYLLTTTFTARNENTDIPLGSWRALNLELPPIGFPPPLKVINENCTEHGGIYSDKSLALWRISDLPG